MTLSELVAEGQRLLAVLGDDHALVVHVDGEYCSVESLIATGQHPSGSVEITYVSPFLDVPLYKAPETQWVLQKIIGNHWQTLATFDTEEEVRNAQAFPLPATMQLVKWTPEVVTTKGPN